MNMKRLAGAVLVAVLLTTPAFAQRGQADFTRFVAIGDSYGAGVVHQSLNERHQPWSWPAVIARQAGLSICAPNAAATANCFAVPWVTYPGIGPELQLQSLTVGPVPGSGLGTPVMTQFGRPYNNLAVPGATVGAVLGVTGAEPQQPGEPTVVTFSRFILRGLGTQVQQALAQNPTFIAVWIGGNDYLGAALGGTPDRLTPVATFKAQYETMLDTLIAGAPSAGIVVGNLPAKIPPVLTLVPPVLVDPVTRQPIPGPDGNPIFFIADLGGGNIGQLPPGSLVTLDARSQIALGYGLPELFKNIPPFNQLPFVGQPLADRYVLTPAEIGAIIARVGEYNSVIQQAATARNVPVADVAGLFNRVMTPAGWQLGPINVNGAFISGGFFSYDGFHLTDLGYLLMANEYIETINEAWDTFIPVASITQLYANNGGLFPDVSAANVVFADGVAEQLRYDWAARATRSFRTTAHEEEKTPRVETILNRDRNKN
jgi:lysophospholipase L1-like esterase